MDALITEAEHGPVVTFDIGLTFKRGDALPRPASAQSCGDDMACDQLPCLSSC
ncbi:hypothetical protein [Streptomyces sp. NPDC020667]|uniref:hypothetical protein n=1 Tax=Streptomyces sp. NPDC020667 TaxID=3154895 RepID=UPI0033D5CBAB